MVELLVVLSPPLKVLVEPLVARGWLGAGTITRFCPLPLSSGGWGPCLESASVTTTFSFCRGKKQLPTHFPRDKTCIYNS